VFLGNSSVAWLLTTIEEMLKGENLRDFIRTSRVGSGAYIASQEFASSCRGKVGFSEDGTLRGTDGCGRGEARALPGSLGFSLLSLSLSSNKRKGKK
jgi:hypothetical protein